MFVLIMKFLITSSIVFVVSQSMNLLKLFKYIRNLTLGEKYLIFKNLQEEIRINEPFLIDIYETANTFG